MSEELSKVLKDLKSLQDEISKASKYSYMKPMSSQLFSSREQALSSAPKEQKEQLVAPSVEDIQKNPEAFVKYMEDSIERSLNSMFSNF